MPPYPLSAEPRELISDLVYGGHGFPRKLSFGILCKVADAINDPYQRNTSVAALHGRHMSLSR